MTPPHVKRDHWGFDDPAKAQGTDEEKWAFFQRVRDEIGDRIKCFAETGRIRQQNNQEVVLLVFFKWKK